MDVPYKTQPRVLVNVRTRDHARRDRTRLVLLEARPVSMFKLSRSHGGLHHPSSHCVMGLTGSVTGQSEGQDKGQQRQVNS